MLNQDKLVKSDKQGIIHTGGQVGYSEEQVRDNVEAFLSDLKKAKPPSSKGVFISKFLSHQRWVKVLI